MSLADEAERLLDTDRTEDAARVALVSIARSLERIADASEERNLRERFFAEESGVDPDELFAHYATGRSVADVPLADSGPLSGTDPTER